MTKINGLLTQKPTSPVPKCGEKHRYSLTQRTSKAGKPWTKVKAEGEGYGELYEVLSVEKTDFVDAHGNVSFNIDLAELSGGTVDGIGEAHPVAAQAAPAQPDKDWPEAKPVPTVRSTSSNGAVVAGNKELLEQCIDDVVSVLDSRLTALVEAASPDAQLETVRCLVNTLFIRSHK